MCRTSSILLKRVKMQRLSVPTAMSGEGGTVVCCHGFALLSWVTASPDFLHLPDCQGLCCFGLPRLRKTLLHTAVQTVMS